ncbi:MAG: hypothetical protein WC052_06245 [Patescibacteria group bacterium]
MTIRIGNPKGIHLYEVEVSDSTGKVFKIEVTAHDRRIAETAAKNAGYDVHSINMVG